MCRSLVTCALACLCVVRSFPVLTCAFALSITRVPVPICAPHIVFAFAHTRLIHLHLPQHYPREPTHPVSLHSHEPSRLMPSPIPHGPSHIPASPSTRSLTLPPLPSHRILYETIYTVLLQPLALLYDT